MAGEFYIFISKKTLNYRGICIPVSTPLNLVRVMIRSDVAEAKTERYSFTVIGLSVVPFFIKMLYLFFF